VSKRAGTALVVLATLGHPDARGVKRVILRWEIIEVSPVRDPAGAAVGTLEVSCD
jgi:hypothetical protein